VHQPLHATTRFSKTPDELKDGDKGGNEIKIKTCATCSETNLHSYWDGLLDTDDTPASVSSAAYALPSVSASSSNNDDVASWIGDSFEKAKTVAYASPSRTESDPTPSHRPTKTPRRPWRAGELHLLEHA
jgi:hypothetical protein